jgi:hypothetical protein
VDSEALIDRLRKRAEIRRQIATRKSVQEGKPDRISDLLEEAADRIEGLQRQLPEGMKECTILLRHCPVGHAWLTATNWVEFGCPTCEIQELQRLVPAQPPTYQAQHYQHPGFDGELHIGEAEHCAACRAEIDRMHREGEEIRKEIARRVEPMKRGPFGPPVGRQIATRKSVQEGKPDRIADLLEEAATAHEAALARAEKAEAELERWRHGVQIEGDYVCPLSLERDAALAREAKLREALESIARNSCCAPCREAGLVAAAALAEEGT